MNNDKFPNPIADRGAVTVPSRQSPEWRLRAARDALARRDHVAAGWYMYGVGPAGTRPKDCT